MSTSLPQNDTTPKNRRKQIRSSQRKYQWKFDTASLPNVPMANGLHLNDLPPTEWIEKVGLKGVLLLENNILNGYPRSIRDYFLGYLRKFIFHPFNSLRSLTGFTFHPFNSLKKLTSFNFNPFASLKNLAGLNFNPFHFLMSRAEIDLNDTINLFTNLATEFTIPDKAVRPGGLPDYSNLFNTIDVPPVAEYFCDDSMFALQRVAGQNPVMLQGITGLNDQFPVTDAMLQQVGGFENDTLQQAGADGRLFIADYASLSELRDANSGNGQKYSYAPKALFAVPAVASDNPMDSLAPIAIQTEQAPSATNLFTPADNSSWLIAKTLIQAADFNYHELATHLTQTHLQMERFCVATHRQLADNHPLHRLLISHFQGTLFINFGAGLALVNDGGPFSELFSGTMASNRDFISKVQQWSFNDEIFPRNLASRKVENIPYYPYRDDGKKVWDAITKWVSDYLSLYYGAGTDDNAVKTADVLADTELASWATELQSSNGGKLEGFGDDGDGEIKTFEYLVEAVTSIIFTASAQHAAVNFPQSQFSGYPPNMSAALYQPAPVDNRADFQDWLDRLPPLNMAELQILVTNILTATVHGELGQYKKGTFSDRRVRPVLSEFKTALNRVNTDIENRITRDRNNGAQVDYDYLQLNQIPQSINI